MMQQTQEYPRRIVAETAIGYTEMVVDDRWPGPSELFQFNEAVSKSERLMISGLLAHNMAKGEAPWVIVYENGTYVARKLSWRAAYYSEPTPGKLVQTIKALYYHVA